jgi:RNA methyltransferase, TrmH family
MKTISSRANPLIQSLVELHHAEGRLKQRKYIAEGLRICETLCMYNKPEFCFVLEKHCAWAQEHCSDNTIIIVSESVMQKISCATNPSGILMVFMIHALPILTTLSDSIVLYEMQDPGNVGTLLRTACAVGIKNIIAIGGIDLWNPKVVQASAGTIGKLRCYSMTWDSLLAYKESLQLCALVVKDGVHPSLLKKPVTLVVGSEAHGLPESKVRDCGQQCTLPMPGGTESLNAAVAASIALYLTQKN